MGVLGSDKGISLGHNAETSDCEILPGCTKTTKLRLVNQLYFSHTEKLSICVTLPTPDSQGRRKQTRASPKASDNKFFLNLLKRANQKYTIREEQSSPYLEVF